MELSKPPSLGIILAYAKSFIGLPYIWGGAHPSLGYDCSGLMQEFLASVGLDPPGDQTAQTLYLTLRNSCIVVPNGAEKKPGTILFFGSSTETITHVAFATDEHHMIEAGGGGRASKDIKSAIANGAFVRVRPITNRKDLVACLLPKY